jgi:crotonobetainyl-CoA:carnitine CoA-transferase CaiB-like acyl-CoA transferase
VQLYKTQDGWIFLMCMTEKFWQELVNALERPDLAADRRFATSPLRRANREALTPLLDAALSRDTTDNWIKKLGGRLPAAPVHDMAGALDNPFLQRTGMIRNTPHPVRSDFRTLASPIKLDGQRLPSRVCSALGADTDELLREAGLTEQELSELHAAAVA